MGWAWGVEDDGGGRKFIIALKSILDQMGERFLRFARFHHFAFAGTQYLSYHYQYQDLDCPKKVSATRTGTVSVSMARTGNVRDLSPLQWPEPRLHQDLVLGTGTDQN